jgi:esterase/lipase superfamily enzyme
MQKVTPVLFAVICSFLSATATSLEAQSLAEVKVLKGTVLRITSASANDEKAKPRTEIAKDTIVALCVVVPEQFIGASYSAVVSTVSDSKGAYELVIPDLVGNKTYALRARGVGDVWSTHVLGTGEQESSWIKPTPLTVGDTPSVRDSILDVGRKQAIKQVELQQRQIDLNKIIQNPDAQQNTALVQEKQKELELVLEQQAVLTVRKGELNAFQQRSTQEEDGHFGTRRVMFATDRAIERSSTPIQIKNKQNADGALAFGYCDVAVERQGRLSNNFINLIKDRDADRYYSVQQLSLISENTMWSDATTALKADSTHDALLFVHGFNSSFDDACRRAAQIAYDLKFEGPVFAYSWPSNNSLADYKKDGDMADWSGPHFTKFLKQALELKGLNHLHIVAHSMGNRILTKTIFVDTLTVEEQAHLGQVVFAAPDVARSDFDQFDTGKVKAQRLTLYASNHDQALIISKLRNGGSRAGDARPEIDVKVGVDSVDASAVDTSLLGHSYIGESRSVLSDLYDLVSANKDPNKRFGVIPRGQPPKEWWVLNP